MASSSAAAPRSASVPAIALALASVYLIWGSTYLGIRFALEGGWPPLLAVSGGRMLIAGLLLYAVLRWRGVSAPTRAQWPTLAAMGVLMMLLGNGAVVLAEEDVSSGLAAIAIASMPLWMGLFGLFFRQRPSRGEWFGIGIGFVGVLWLNAGSSLASTPRGLVLLLIAPIAWAFGSVWSRGRDLPSPFMAAAGQMLCGGLMLVVLGRSPVSAPICGCCSTCARRWPAAMPTSIRRSRSCSARGWRTSVSARTTSARWR